MGDPYELLSFEDARGRALWDVLPEAAQAHMRRFAVARPDVQVILHSNQLVDEIVLLPFGEPLKLRPRADHLHQYQAGTIYALNQLRRRRAVHVVDIGSPIEQNLAVAAMDTFALTVVDIRAPRRPDLLPFRSVQATATALPFGDGTLDLITSNCVLCHVGDGRYGDAFDVDGDLHMLRECARVVTPDGRLILGLGPMHWLASLIFNVHRVYSPEWARRLFELAGLRALDFQVYDFTDGSWLMPDQMEGNVFGNYYGFATLERAAV